MGLLDSFKTSAFGSASKENADSSVKSTFNTSIDSSPPTISTAPRPLQLGSFDFDSSSNGYKYPTLFEEADDMIKLSNLIYTLIELRELARNGKLEGHDKSLRITELPLPMDRALSIIASEAEVLKRVLSDGAHEEALSALRALVGARLLDSGGNNAKSSSTVQPLENGTGTVKSESGLFGSLLDMWNNCFPRTVLHDDDDVHNKTTTSVPEYKVSTITAVGDEKCQEELVYVVGVNPATKRITVAFRGSTTKTDFVTDARMDMVRVPGPRAFASQYNMETNNGNHNNSNSNSNNHNSNHKNSTKTECSDDEMESNICIHQGFYEYLFGSTSDNDTSRKQTKFHEIMTHIQTLLDSNPAYRTDYKLYITGHSLGGALATLFGFYASSFHPTLPRPVTVVSVASPRVGNSEFARTFARFESYGDLRHLRIANHKDPVTLGPTVSSKRALTLATMMLSPLGYAALKLSGRDAGAEETYCHTGMKMKLRKEVVGVEGKRCELSYSGKVFLAEKDDGGEGVAKDGDGGGKGDEEEDFGKKSSVSSSLLAAQDVPLVSYHFGGAYAERIALVKDELDGLTLNQLYLEKAAAK